MSTENVEDFGVSGESYHPKTVKVTDDPPLDILGNGLSFGELTVDVSRLGARTQEIVSAIAHIYDTVGGKHKLNNLNVAQSRELILLEAEYAVAIAELDVEKWQNTHPLFVDAVSSWVDAEFDKHGSDVDRQSRTEILHRLIDEFNDDGEDPDLIRTAQLLDNEYRVEERREYVLLELGTIVSGSSGYLLAA